MHDIGAEAEAKRLSEDIKLDVAPISPILGMIIAAAARPAPAQEAH